MNLSREQPNADRLLELNLFTKMKVLVDKFLIHEEKLKETAEGASNSLLTASRSPIQNDLAVETSIVCYINSIFTRLLNSNVKEQAKESILNQEGHRVFLNILSRPQTYSHLFMETLDALKYLLTDRRFLSFFNEIPKYVEFSKNMEDELNVSYLQILALLSFDRANHHMIHE